MIAKYLQREKGDSYDRDLSSITEHGSRYVCIYSLIHILVVSLKGVGDGFALNFKQNQGKMSPE